MTDPITVSKRTGVARLNVSANGDAQRTSTLTAYVRDPEEISGLVTVLPDKLARHELTVHENNRLFLPVDGSVTSLEFKKIFADWGMSAAAIGALSPLVSSAVVAAQVGAAGITTTVAPVAMEAAPQTVANLANREASLQV